MNSDERYMRLALRLAARAASSDEVPVGAVVVCDGRVVGRGHNQVEAKRSALRHAEIDALRQNVLHALQAFGGWLALSIDYANRFAIMPIRIEGEELIVATAESNAVRACPASPVAA